MNPFFFGSSDRALYGVYTPPKTRGRVQSGVVLCAPFGMEYMRSHRAFRQLTSLLNREGHHVLRFDYFGTGDSAGEGEDGSVEQWSRDVDTAIEELRDTTSLDRVSVVGLRFGGLLAAQVAVRRNDLNRVVLWDPIVRGKQYVREMLDSEGALPENGGGSPAGVRGTVGIAGFPLTERLRAEMEGVDLTTLDATAAKELVLVVSSEQPEYLALRDAWKAAGVRGRYRLVPSAGNWAEGDKFGSALIPQAIIQDVVSCLS
jgi:uncharacterized protein